MNPAAFAALATDLDDDAFEEDLPLDPLDLPILFPLGVMMRDGRAGMSNRGKFRVFKIGF